MYLFFFFFKQKTAYEMRISDWSSDVCSSDLGKKRRIPLDTVPHYFPAVISPETWADAQALLTAKGAPRGRQAVAPLSNILSRLATCPKCAGTMTRVQKGDRKSTRLNSSH